MPLWARGGDDVELTLMDADVHAVEGDVNSKRRGGMQG